MKYLYIRADFDENNLISELFLDIESLSNFILYEELSLQEIYENQGHLDVKNLSNLLQHGYVESEWWSEELWVIDENGCAHYGMEWLNNV